MIVDIDFCIFVLQHDVVALLERSLLGAQNSFQVTKADTFMLRRKWLNPPNETTPLGEVISPI